MYEPWDQDPREKWWARIQHATVAPFDRADVEAVKRVLLDTGMVRQPNLIPGETSIVVWVAVKADSVEEAAVTASRVIEVAHREAGHGLTVRRLRRSAMSYRTRRATHETGDDGAL